MNSVTMKSSPFPSISMPGIGHIYWNDSVFGRAARITAFSLIAGFGIHWASQPQPNAVVKVENSPLELFVMQWAIPLGLAFAAVALFIATNRYLWIKKVITQGSTVKGIVEKFDEYTREAPHSDTTPAFQRPKIRTYYVTIRYSFRGEERKLYQKLPNSPGTFQISKEKEVDLLIHDSSPQSPLISAVYRDPSRFGRH